VFFAQPAITINLPAIFNLTALCCLIIPAVIEFKRRGAWLGSVAGLVFTQWHPFGGVFVSVPTPGMPRTLPGLFGPLDTSQRFDMTPVIAAAIFTVLGIGLASWFASARPRSKPGHQGDAPHADVPDLTDDKPCPVPKPRRWP
jgi:hypothetical protein